MDKLLPNYNLCAKFNNGINSHCNTEIEDKNPSFHLLPSGILHPQCKCLLGNEMIIYFPTLLEELKQVESMKISTEGRLLIGNQYKSL